MLKTLTYIACITMIIIGLAKCTQIHCDKLGYVDKCYIVFKIPGVK